MKMIRTFNVVSLTRCSIGAVAIALVLALTMPATADQGFGRGGDPDRPGDPIFVTPPTILKPWTTGPRIFLHTVQEDGEDDDSGIRNAGLHKPLDDLFDELADLPLISDGMFDQPPSDDLLRLPAPAPWPTLTEPGRDFFNVPADTIADAPAGSIPGPGAWPLLAAAALARRRRRRD
jgi:MYXO-CTERM domain-containing protein